MANAAITVDLNARIAGFETDLKKATATLDNFGARGNAVAGVMKSAFVGLASAVSVGALASFAKSGIDAADALNDMSLRLKVSVKDLASFQLIAEQSGTSLEGVGKGIARLTRSMGDAEGGNKQLAAALATLGITARDPKEAFYQLADAVQKIQDPAQRATLLNQVLGKSYQELIPLLEGGGQALRESAKASESFSSAMARLAPDADRFNDQLASIKINSAGAAASILSKMLPSLNSLISRFNAGTIAAGGFWAAAAKGLKFSFTTPGEGLEKLGKRFSVLHQQLDIAREKGDTGTAARLESERAEILQEMKYLNAIKAASLPPVLDKPANRDGIGGAIDLSAARSKAKSGGASKAKSDQLASLLASTDIGRMEEFDKKVSMLNARFDDGRKSTELYTQAMTKLIETVFSANFSDFDKQQKDAIAASKEYAAVQAEFERAGVTAAKAAEQDAAAIATQVIAQREHNEEIGLSAVALQELEQARLDVSIAALQQYEAERMIAGASNEELAAIWAKIDALTELKKLRGEGAAAQGNFDALKDMNDYLDPAKAQSFGDALSNSFGKAGTAIGKMAGAFDNFARKQAEFSKISAKLAPGDIENQTKMRRKQAEIQIDAYAEMATAAKGFFKENSTGYKVMEGVEKALHLVQMANMASKLFAQLGFTAAKVAGDATSAASGIASDTAQLPAAIALNTVRAVGAVANQGNGDPYTAFPRIAAMIAIMAGLGLAVGGSSGSSVSMSAMRQEKQGTGTVLGDPSAKSNSLANSLDLLADVNVLTMRYSARMAASLRNIEDALTGVSSMIFRTPGLTSGNPRGVFEGNFKSPWDSVLKNGSAGIGDPVGDWILGGLFGKKSQKISDSGLSYTGPVSGIEGGLKSYTDVTTTKKSWFSSSSSTDPNIRKAPDDISRQFGLIFENISDSLEAAGGMFGKSADILETQIANIDIDLGMVSLKGLKGDELKDALNAVISAAADKIAKEALPGLEKYIKVGEGYYETAIRVAYSTEAAQAALKMIGKGFTGAAMEIVDFSQVLIDAFGGLEELTDGLSFYFETFFSTSEQFAYATVTLAGGFNSLGLSMPKTSAGFRDMVNSIDTTTEAGADLFAGLIKLAPAFDSVIGAIERIIISVNGMFADTIENIGLSVMSNEQQYTYWRNKIDTDVAALMIATDPADIARLSGRINTGINSAYGLLDETQQQALAPDFIDFAGDANTIATERLNAAPDNILILDAYKDVAGVIKTAIADAAAVMLEAAQTQLAAANTPVKVDVDVTVNTDGTSVEVGP